MKRNFNLFMILLLLLLSACGNNSNHVHEWNESGIISRPTCTESGLARFVCNLCEETKVDINLEALGHNEVVDNAIEATCTKTGLTEGSHCDICSEVLVRQEVIPVLEHEWNEGIVTFEPVKGVEGEKTFTCKICGEHKYEVIPAIEVADGEIYEVDGIKYVNYGSYPQTHVGDEALLLELNKLTAINDRGYYEYNGKEYAKVTAMPFRTGSYNDSYGNTIYYEYSDGSRIQKNTIEWFKVEPIKWRIISETGDGSYQLYSEYILDATKYYNDEYYRSINGVAIAPNNYKYSNIRAWLNGYDGTDYMISDYTNKGFYNRAFKESEKGSIITSEVDNGASTTMSSPNIYACENTFDKIYLLSHQDMFNSNYGFTDTALRYAQVTDYAKAVGAYWSTSVKYLDNGYYWLRSPYIGDSCDAHCVDEYGNRLVCYYVDYTHYGVRVACNINL